MCFKPVFNYEFIVAINDVTRLVARDKIFVIIRPGNSLYSLIMDVTALMK